MRSKSGEQKTSPEPHDDEDKRSDMIYQKAELSDEHARHELPEALLQGIPEEWQLHECLRGNRIVLSWKGMGDLDRANMVFVWSMLGCVYRYGGL